MKSHKGMLKGLDIGMAFLRVCLTRQCWCACGGRVRHCVPGRCDYHLLNLLPMERLSHDDDSCCIVYDLGQCFLFRRAVLVQRSVEHVDRRQCRSVNSVGLCGGCEVGYSVDHDGYHPMQGPYHDGGGA